MNIRFQTLGAAAFALIAVTVSSAAVHNSYAVKDPILVPPMLTDGRLTGQVSTIPINEFTPKQAADGIILPKDSHNFFRCEGLKRRPSTLHNNLGTARTWVYEFTGKEQDSGFEGAFFISDGELATSPQYRAINTLEKFNTNRRYYQMGAVDLRFKCGEGLSLVAFCGDNSCNSSENAATCPQDCNVCGDGVVHGSEQCDDGNGLDHDGCDVFCTIEEGYVCEGKQSQCSLLIPMLPGGGGGSSSNGMSSFGMSSSPQGGCSDPDGDDIYTKGTATYNGQSETDFCANNSTVVEYTCGLGFLGGQIEQCANGCVDGACIVDNGGDGGAIGSNSGPGPGNTDASILGISIDGPATSDHSATEKNVNLGNIAFDTGNANIDVDSIFIAVHGLTSDNTDFGGLYDMRDILENVRLQKLGSQETYVGTRLTSSVDFGQSFGSEPGTFQIYRFDDIKIRGNEQLQLLVDFIDNGSNGHPRDGDKFRIHICGEPTHVVYGNEDDIIINTKGCDFGGLIYESTAYQMFVSSPSSGIVMANVTPRGTIASNFQNIGGSAVWNVASQGSLYVTKDTTPVPNRQLLGGTLTGAVLRLQFHAEEEDADVTFIEIAADGTTTSIDKLELYNTGDSTPFASATREACGNSANEFCAVMENQQLVVPKGNDVDVIVLSKMKTDEQGGITGEVIQLGLRDHDAVKARGLVSSNDYSENNGDNAANGEVFIGTDAPGPNSEIAATTHVSVLSKITSITNANPPDQNDTSVPTGITPIGQFTFTAAAHNNSKNGDNNVAIDGIIFTIHSTNVVMDATSFKFYNTVDATETVPCEAYYMTGAPFTSANISNSFKVLCKDIDISTVNGEIDQEIQETVDAGTFATFALQADIINPKMNIAAQSTLQVSLENFNEIDTTFGVNGSHILWLDVDAVDGAEFHWIEYPETVINSTQYNS